MLPLRNPSVGGFLVRFLLVFGVLLVPWPGLGHAYAVLFRAGGDLVLGSFPSGVDVRFRPLPEGEAKWNTELVVRNRQTQAVGSVPMSSRSMGYVPTAVLVGLVLATPIPWPRRRRALFWGLILVHGFVVLRLGLVILDGLSRSDALAPFIWGPFWGKVLSRAAPALGHTPAGSYIVPVLIWVFVSFRRRDWFALFGQAQPGRNTAPVSRRTARWGRAS